MSNATPTVVNAGEQQVSRSIVVNAPVEELFALIANPHRHHELDGSGTVRDQAVGPDQLAEGDTFTVRMKMFMFPYKITSTATRVEAGKIIEWRHPGGHHWRYEFEVLGTGRTRVTETFDYRQSTTATVYKLLGMPGRNASGIERTLEKLAHTYA